MPLHCQPALFQFLQKALKMMKPSLSVALGNLNFFELLPLLLCLMFISRQPPFLPPPLLQFFRFAVLVFSRTLESGLALACPAASQQYTLLGASICDVHIILGFFDPLPSLSAKSILFVCKLQLFLDPPLLCGRHIWKPSWSRPHANRSFSLSRRQRRKIL